MKPSEGEIRIAIAGACGWKSYMDAEGDLSEPHLTRHFEVWEDPNGEQYSGPPDYPNDLNAMHGAVASKPYEWRAKFQRGLTDMAIAKNVLVVDLLARDWAEVFLRQEGLWQE